MELQEAELTKLVRLAGRLSPARLSVAGGAQPHRRRAGRGSELLEFRPYSAGDELRRVNWRLSARSRVPQVRSERDESSARWVLCMDCSASMGVDARAWELARTLAAAFGFLLLNAGQQVSLLAFADGLAAYSPAGRGRPQYLRLLRILEGLRPTGTKSTLNGCLASLGRRPAVVLVSDFLTPDAMGGQLSTLLRLGAGVQALQVQSPAAWSVSAGEMTDEMQGLVDAESGARLEVSLDSPHARLEVRRRVEALDHALAGFCRRHAIAHSRYGDTKELFVSALELLGLPEAKRKAWGTAVLARADAASADVALPARGVGVSRGKGLAIAGLAACGVFLLSLPGHAPFQPLLALPAHLATDAESTGSMPVSAGPYYPSPPWQLLTCSWRRRGIPRVSPRVWGCDKPPWRVETRPMEQGKGRWSSGRKRRPARTRGGMTRLAPFRCLRVRRKSAMLVFGRWRPGRGAGCPRQCPWRKEAVRGIRA